VKILIAFLFCAVQTFGQVNLVSNPGFEDFSSCPDSYNEIWYCVDWTGVPGCVSTSDVADYFHTCSVNGYAPPSVGPGWQQPHSGNAYCGISTSSTVATNCHEYCETMLINPLVQGQKYNLSFYASLAGHAYFTLASNKLGALFTTHEIDNYSLLPSINYAQVYTDSVITDTAGWFCVSGSFIADSAYAYMTIGNFFDDSHTIRQPLNGNATYAWYFIDDVYLSIDDDESVNDIESTNPFFLYPNPTNGSFTIHQDNFTIKPISYFKIIDTTGKTVYESTQTTMLRNDLVLDLNLENGIYFLLVNGSNDSGEQKIVVIR